MDAAVRGAVWRDRGWAAVSGYAGVMLLGVAAIGVMMGRVEAATHAKTFTRKGIIGQIGTKRRGR
ncbi:MAG: hypothetical protein JO111_14950 [Caulobacteraceae bacterium]|nr:hypothetical protein [Caulobacteraceae bacterium]